jgi:rhodanese-related sulfurtransferase
MPSNLPLYVGLALLAAWLLSSKLGKTSPSEARALVERGAKLVDVRSASEFAAGHLPGALNVPVGEIGRRAKELGDPQAPVVVYCASGMRSASAARSLRALGFAHVHDLGAMSRW